MTLNAGELAQVRSELNLWWGSYWKIVKPRRGDHSGMPDLLDGEQFYSQDTNENFVGDDLDGPHIVSGIMQGTKATIPAAGVIDRMYYATDEDVAYIDDGSVWRVFGTGLIRKSIDEPRTTDSVLSNDSELSFDINANEKCVFEFTIFMTMADANPDIQVAAWADFGITDIRYVTQFMDASPSSVVAGQVYTASGAPGTYNYSGAVDSVIYIRGSVENAGTNNTIALQWAQNSSHATATVVKEGSFVKWKIVG